MAEVDPYAELQKPPSADPYTALQGNSDPYAELQKPQAEARPGFLSGVLQGGGAGLEQAAERIKQTKQGLTAGEDIEASKPDTNALAQPFDWSLGAPNWSKIGYHLSSGLSSGSPEIAGMVGGGLLGAGAGATTGPGAPVAVPVGAALGAGLGAAATTEILSFAGNFKAALDQTGGDREKAFELARRQTAAESLASGVGGATGGIGAEGSPVLYLLKQMFLQGGVGAGQKAALNVVEGKPAEEGVLAAGGEAGLGAVVPIAGHAILGGIHPGVHAALPSPDRISTVPERALRDAVEVGQERAPEFAKSPSISEAPKGAEIQTKEGPQVQEAPPKAGAPEPTARGIEPQLGDKGRQTTSDIGVLQKPAAPASRLSELPRTPQEVELPGAMTPKEKQGYQYLKAAVRARNVSELARTRGDTEGASTAIERANKFFEKATALGATIPTPKTLPLIDRPIATPEVYRGFGRASQDAVYNSAPVAIAGEGKYYSFDRNTASDYGPKLEVRKTDSLQPEIVRSDDDWKALTYEAGWPSPNLHGYPTEEVQGYTAKLKSLLQSRGKDSLLVNWDNTAPGTAPLLQKVFDKPQVVVYDNAKQASNVVVPSTVKIKRYMEGMRAASQKQFKVEYPNVDLTKIKPGRIALPAGRGPIEPQLLAVAQEVVRAYLPDSRVIIDTEKPPVAGAYASFIGIADGTIILRIDKTKWLTLSPLEHASILAHELGHAVVFSHFHKADFATQQIIYAAFEQKLARMGDADGLQIVKEMFSPGNLSTIAANVMKMDPAQLQAGMLKHMEKWYSFDEFMAEQFATHMVTSLRGQSVLSRYVSKVGDAVKGILKRFGLMERDTVETAAQEWFDSLRKDHDQGTLSSTPLAAAMAMLESQERNAAALGESLSTYGTPASMPENLMFESMKIPGFNAKSKAEMDRFGWWTRRSMDLLQFADQNPHIDGLQKYVEKIRSWYIAKMSLISRADGRLREIRGLGKEMGQKLSDFIFTIDRMEYLKPGENGRWPTTQELLTLAQDKGLGKRAVEVYFKIRDDFIHVLDRMESARNADAAAAFKDDPQELQRRLLQIKSDMAALRSRPYFPHERFGDFVLTIKDDKGERVLQQHFENKNALNKALAEAQKTYPKFQSYGWKLPEQLKVFQGIPPALYDSIAQRLNLSREQLQALNDLRFDTAPANSFVKHFKRRSGLEGYSLNFQRSYANYFTHAGGHIARLEYGGDLRDAVQGVHDSAKLMRGAFDLNAVENRQGLADWMSRHLEYNMNPTMELQAVKSLAFLWRLGFNPSSAVINLLQVPMVAAPYLAARFGGLGIGDAKAVAALGRAYTDNARESSGFKVNRTKDEAEARALGLAHGFLDESQASELATSAQHGVLGRLLGGNKLQRAILGIGDAAGFLFKMTEKFNRSVTFDSTYRLGKANPTAKHLVELEARNPELVYELQAKGWRPENIKAFLGARDAIEKTQFEYAKWARPEFMRGAKGSLFVFWNFQRNMLYFLRHDPGAFRALMAIGVTSGAMGLPFAQDISDLLKYVGTKVLGKYWNPELEARKVLLEVGANPDLALHGYGRESLGLTELGNAIGIPIPALDVSSRLGMGRIIPGMRSATDLNASPTDRIAGLTTELLGGGYSVGTDLIKALGSGDPDEFKRIERMLPTAAKNAMHGFRLLAEGGERNAQGALLNEIDPADTEDMAAAVAQGLGFTPTQTAQAYDRNAAISEQTKYWHIRRGVLLDQYDFARRAKDRESLKDVRESMQEYNRTVADKKLRITADSLQRSTLERRKKRKETETARGSRIATETSKLYPEALEK